MENVDKTVEHLEMDAVKVGNRSHVADNIDCFGSQI